MKVRAGQFVNHSEKWISVSDEPTSTVTHITCRRAEDFGPKWGAEIPELAAFDLCARCRARVVYNPSDPRAAKAVAAGAVRICLQCSGFDPMPFGDPS